MIPVGTCATLACIWEATAAKPGNVYRGADFDDVTYADFLTSAAVVGPVLGEAHYRGVGRTLLNAVGATRAAVGTNTNLGALLLLAPLASVPRTVALPAGITGVLDRLAAEDTALVYEAIRTTQPGGLGDAELADVNASRVPELSLVDAMRLAAGRDLVARQYANRFEQVFWAADRIERCPLPLGVAIVHAYLELMAEYPDSLIARKCGAALSWEASRRAARVLKAGDPGTAAYESQAADLDFWLRADGHRRNPGTSADLIAAALFVLLREERLDWPVAFYPKP